MVKTWILSEMENKLAYMCKHGDDKDSDAWYLTGPAPPPS